jgi:hypothetical protein
VSLALAACGGGTSAVDAGSFDAGADGGPPDAFAPPPTDAGPYAFPSVPARCAATFGATHSLTTADGVPVLALARRPSDVGLVYVDRPGFPMMGHVLFQRLATDGSALGTAQLVMDLDMTGAGMVSITHDGTDYLACAIVVGGARCYTIDASDHATELLQVDNASAIAVARGAGGIGAAWVANGELRAGLLSDAAATAGAGGSLVATTLNEPSIAATTSGWVVGWADTTGAYVVRLDQRGVPTLGMVPGPTIALGAARESRVAVASSGDTLGAVFTDTNGDAVLAVVSVVSTGTPTRTTIGPGAMSYGQVSIARAQDGFAASWSDFGGAVHVVLADTTGAVSTTLTHDVAWDDDAHALVDLASGWMLATNTTPSGTPIDVVPITCP